ncbi:MAG TPA: cytochrome c biogenesis protein CcsA [bacterium]|nr:cytochrome c biogenesis protein CcsA [bacterium]
MKLAYIGLLISFLWMAGVLAGAFYFSPSAEILGETSRIIYFHVPVAWICVLAFCMSFWFSISYLRTRRAELDVNAEVTARLGLWFCILATITGAVFAKSAWGMYWNWDPREVSITVILLVYMAYFGLRSSVPDPERRMKLSAVYSIMAFVLMPFLIFVVPWIYSSLHPDTIINVQGENKLLDGRMRMVFFFSLAGFTFVYLWMYRISARIEKLVRRKEGWNV